MGARGYENGFRLTLLPYRLQEPLQRATPTVYFVNSMSDLFHEEIPDEYLLQVFEIMRRASQHTFQVLTKRAERMADFFQSHAPSRNIWLGVTVENRFHGMPRIEALRRIPAFVRFISAEPLLEDLLEINLAGIHWVIVGGESGHGARRMDPEWVRNIRLQCKRQGSAFFFKQWGSWSAEGRKGSKKVNGRVLDGRTWDCAPHPFRAP